mgnify:CR=1 FL=1
MSSPDALVCDRFSPCGPSSQPEATADVDGDHLIPLAHSWRAGADLWDDTTRRAFANSPLNVIIAWDRLNSAKGDKGPEAWQPPNKAAHCLYATRWIAVKTQFKLPLTSTSERTALTTMLNTCPA